MEEDWEVLHAADLSSPKSTAYYLSHAAAAAADAIKSDYFAVDPKPTTDQQGSIDPTPPSEFSHDPTDGSDGGEAADPSDGQMSMSEIGDSGVGEEIEGSGSEQLGDGVDSATEVDLRGTVAEDQILGVVGGGEDAGVGGIGQADGIGVGNERSEEQGGGDMVKIGAGNGGLVGGGGGEKKEVVWWKLPLDLLKFYALRVRPVWSVSVAAAIVGFVMLGRRLYRMRYKSRSIPLKIAMDEKKASQLMVRAAKLNEAFSVVRHVPIIRSSVPVGGATPWPILPLR